MYVPKHRGEPKKVWRVHYLESERGWERDEWYVDFDTPEEAQIAFDRSRPKFAVAPSYYLITTKIEEVTL